MAEFIARVFYNLTEVHPFHTLIVHFPIALTGAGLLFILLAVWKNSRQLEYAAFVNMVLAALSTLLAAFTGMKDNLEIYDGLAPNAGIKVLLAFALLIVTALASYVRWRNPNLFESKKRWMYISAFVLSFLLASVLGFLGGVILYGF